MVKHNDELLSFAHKLLRARNWEQSNLLAKTNEIGVTLLLIVIIANREGSEINLKTLCQSVTFSQRSVAYTIKDLIALGWLNLIQDANDKRRQLIYSTPALFNLFDQYKRHLD
jgi:DNA-binding MarR family transcriptional regulator